MLVFEGILHPPRDDLVTTKDHLIQHDITNVLLVSKQIYSEAVAVFYRSNRFQFIDNPDFMAQLARENLLREHTYWHTADTVGSSQLATVLLSCPKISGFTINDAILDDVMDDPVWLPVLHRILNTQGGFFHLAHVEDVLVCFDTLLGVRIMGQAGAFEIEDVRKYVWDVINSVRASLGLGAPYTGDDDEPLVVTLKGQEIWVKKDWHMAEKTEYIEVVLSLVV